jgi:hypothetical protein
MSARVGKPNATGRSSGKHSGRMKARLGPPEGLPWVWVTRELLESAAWHGLSINARRVIDRLQIEHMSQGGQENGRLFCTHRQLHAFGINKDAVTAAIRECEFLGLIRYERGGLNPGSRLPSTYRLTWLPVIQRSSFGIMVEPATNEWRSINSNHVQALRSKRATRKGASSGRGIDGKWKGNQISAPDTRGKLSLISGTRS